MRNRIKYSQNFLTNQGLISYILENSGITDTDTVLEIGVGKGIITAELLKVAKKVIAYEIDHNYYQPAQEKFKQFENENKLELKNINFLEEPLPDYPFKVFANIPFNKTAEIIKKLVFDPNPPKDTFLIVQKEAAEKFLGKPLAEKNTLMSTIIANLFNCEVFYKFRRDDFYPIPNVNIVMIRITKKEIPSVSNIDLFNDFVAYGMSQFEPNILEGLATIMNKKIIERVGKDNGFAMWLKPGHLFLNQWQALFTEFLKDGNKNRVMGAYKKILRDQEKLEKVNRTRSDREWRNKR